MVPFLIKFRIMPTITARVRKQETKAPRGNRMPSMERRKILLAPISFRTSSRAGSFQELNEPGRILTGLTLIIARTANIDFVIPLA